MPEFGSIAHVIELAIQGERMSEAFYLRLAEMFAHHPEAAAFWRDYAQEEVGHARWLESLRKRADDARLNDAVNNTLMRQAEAAIATPVAAHLEGVGDLQAAYDRANELEHSETNAVFDFLISYFADDAQTRDFLRAQLSEHVGRLVMKFPEKYRVPTVRKGVVAQVNS